MVKIIKNLHLNKDVKNKISLIVDIITLQDNLIKIDS